MRLKRQRWTLFVVWLMGMMLWSVPLYAATETIGDDIERQVLYILVGAAFTVFFWVVRRWVTQVDHLATTIHKLTAETRLDRQTSMAYEKDINILKKRANRFQDWINKHVLMHAKCPECPATDEPV